MARPKSRPPIVASTPDDTEVQFYEALQQADLERLMATWADDDEVVCVHPGGPRVIGVAGIRASFEAIFANGGVPIRPEQVHRLQAQGSAVHHLVERVTVMTDEGPRVAWALATNVYIKAAQGWRLVAHHASSAQLGEPPAAEGDTGAVLH